MSTHLGLKECNVTGFQIGIRMPPAGPLRDLVTTVRAAEAGGLDAVWCPDSHLNYRESWTTLGALAVSTETIQLGLTVTNLSSRHPTVTASAARTLSEASSGRFVLGLGAGDSAIGFDGLRHSNAKELQEGARAIRTLVQGGSVRYGRFEAALRDAAEVVPIYLAASGPLALRAAGAVADGVIITLGNNEEKLRLIAEGAAKHGRETPPVFVYTGFALTGDIESLSRSLKPGCIRIAQLEGREVFERAGVHIQVPDHTVGADGDVGHMADPEEALRLVDHLVSDEAALWYAKNRTLMGTADEIARRLEELARAGIAGVTLNGSGPHGLAADLVEQVLPRLRGTLRGQA
jgi:5,10-methylenetetrahydromethanopterin reductase